MITGAPPAGLPTGMGGAEVAAEEVEGVCAAAVRAAFHMGGRIDPKSVGEALKRRGASPDILRQRGSIPPDGA